MTVTIPLTPEQEERLREEAAARGQDASGFLASLIALLVAALTARPRREPEWVGQLTPRIPPPPGESALARLVGAWPGDETDAALQAERARRF